MELDILSATHGGNPVRSRVDDHGPAVGTLPGPLVELKQQRTRMLLTTRVALPFATADDAGVGAGGVGGATAGGLVGGTLGWTTGCSVLSVLETRSDGASTANVSARESTAAARARTTASPSRLSICKRLTGPSRRVESVSSSDSGPTR